MIVGVCNWRLFFIFWNVLEIARYGIPPLAKNATEAHKIIHQELKKKDAMGFFITRQCVDPNIFEMIAKEESVKGVWDISKKAYNGMTGLRKWNCELWRANMRCCKWMVDIYYWFLCKGSEYYKSYGGLWINNWWINEDLEDNKNIEI